MGIRHTPPAGVRVRPGHSVNISASINTSSQVNSTLASSRPFSFNQNREDASEDPVTAIFSRASSVGIIEHLLVVVINTRGDHQSPVERPALRRGEVFPCLERGLVPGEAIGALGIGLWKDIQIFVALPGHHHPDRVSASVRRTASAWHRQ